MVGQAKNCPFSIFPAHRIPVAQQAFFILSCLYPLQSSWQCDWWYKILQNLVGLPRLPTAYTPLEPRFFPRSFLDNPTLMPIFHSQVIGLIFAVKLSSDTTLAPFPDHTLWIGWKIFKSTSGSTSLNSSFFSFSLSSHSLIYIARTNQAVPSKLYLETSSCECLSSSHTSSTFYLTAEHNSVILSTTL